MLTETLLDFAMMHANSLILKAQNGDELAFSKLMSLWYKRVYNFSFKYFTQHDLAMEVTQRTFIAMHKSLPNLKDTGSFKPWLYRIALNYCHEEDRKRKRGGLSSLFGLIDSNSEPITNARNASPERMLVQSELAEVLIEALGKLSSEQKEVVIMKEYEGFKFREIAETIDVSENTVKSRLYYGLKNLKKILDESEINLNTVDYG